MYYAKGALNLVLRGSNGAGSAESPSASSSSSPSPTTTNTSASISSSAKNVHGKAAAATKKGVKISSTKTVQSFDTSHPAATLKDVPSVQHLVTETVHGNIEMHPQDLRAIHVKVMKRDPRAPQRNLILPWSGRRIKNLHHYQTNGASPSNLVFCMDPENKEDFKIVTASIPEHDAFVLDSIELSLEGKKGGSTRLHNAAIKFTIDNFYVNWTSFYARNKDKVDALTGKDTVTATDAQVTIPQSTLDDMNHSHELNALTADQLITTNNSQASMFTEAIKDINDKNIEHQKEQAQLHSQEKKEIMDAFGGIMEKAIAGVHQAYATSNNNNSGSNIQAPATARKARRACLPNVVAPTPCAPATTSKVPRRKAFAPAPVRRLKPDAQLPRNAQGNECGRCVPCWKKYNFCPNHRHLLDVLTETVDF